MSKREMTMGRYYEIKRQLELKIPVLTIAKNLGCTERTVRQIRDGSAPSPDAPREFSQPAWCEGIEWATVLKEVLDGHPIKFIWSERAESKIGYKAFWEQFHRKYPHYKMATSVHREFAPGERCEVDYSGSRACWVQVSTGEIFEMDVFIGILGYSQLIYADATDDQTSPHFLASHARMFSAFEGAPQITVPDCLKQGVTKTHLYDPDVNRSYQALAEHYGTVIVPARPGRPKDKALVEGAVKLVWRLYRWRTRGAMPASRHDVNRILAECAKAINEKPHTRFKISRRSSWLERERAALRALPLDAYEYCEWKTATLHPDCHLVCDGAHYSAPNELRGCRLKVKIGDRTIEIFYGLERVALHARDRSKRGAYTTELAHLPENAKAYVEATPQNVLSQSKFISSALHELIDELFAESAMGHLRRGQGFVREARSAIKRLGREQGALAIAHGVAQMRRFDRKRVPYFKEILLAFRVTDNATAGSKINRKPNNPMLRYAGGPKLAIVQTKQEEIENGIRPIA